MQAMESGRLPEPSDSIDSQRKFRELKDEGLYNPLIGGGNDAGRPEGETSPQTTKKVSPVGENTTGSAKFSVEKIKENLANAQKLEAQVQESLKLKYENKRVTNKIRSISDEVCKVIMANEPADKWIEKAQDYIDNPVDTNHNRVEEVEAIACEHQVDDYLASLLLESKI